MGEINSGRRNGKRTTDQARQVDIRTLHHMGALKPDDVCDLNWHRHGHVTTALTLQVRSGDVVMRVRESLCDGTWRSYVQTIRFTWTACHYGGQRPWWLCPKCGRRVAILYNGQGQYVCRHCLDLTYRSQRETDKDLAARRARAIRARLGWPLGLLELPGGKPRGMHQSTYLRLLIAHIHHSQEALGWVEQNLRSLNASLRCLQARQPKRW